MRLAELAILYATVGVGCAVALGVRRVHARATWTDVALLACLWPLYGPFVLVRIPAQPEGLSQREVVFLAALRQARNTPLAALLPDEQAVHTLGQRLRVAAAKVHEIDSLLGTPEFCERDALARQRQLASRGSSGTTQATLAFRLQNIRQLRRLRDRFARELEEIEELLQQLRTQVEVVRLVGVADHNASELVGELLSRVEGLDGMLDDEPPAPTPPLGGERDAANGGSRSGSFSAPGTRATVGRG